MPLVYLAKLATHRLPMFVSTPAKLRHLCRLCELGHVEAHFYPPDPREAKFAQVRSLTPTGRAALAACVLRTPDKAC